VKSPVVEPEPDPVVDATVHGIPGLSDTPEQQKLIHGINLKGHAVEQSEWIENNGKPVFLHSDPIEIGWGAAQAESAYYNAARSAFDLHHYLPTTATFRHPDSGSNVAAVDAIPQAEHLDTDDAHRAKGAHAFVLKHLGDTGELAKLAVMDTVMGTDRNDHNILFTFAAEPHMRLTDNHQQDGIVLNNPPKNDPAYLRHYSYVTQQPWQARPVPDATHKWLAGVDFRNLESSLAKSGMPYHQADEAVRRLIEMKAHSKKFGKTATLGSLLMSPWAAL
jgi:hypothetical protein